MVEMSLLLLGVMLNTIAQLLLKEGMNRIGYFAFSLHNIVPIAQQIIKNPFVLTGISSYVFSVTVWLMVLSRVQVSFAYPMLSLGYIVNAIAAYYLFDENLSLTRVSGIFIIIIGVYLVSRS